MVPGERANRRLRPLLVAVAAAIVTLVLIGGVAWLAPFGGGTSPADEPTVTTVTTVLPSQPVLASDVGSQIEVNGLPCEIVADESGVWVGGPDESTYCTLSEGQLSTEPGLFSVLRIDPATNQVEAAIDLSGRNMDQAALGEGRLWITAFEVGGDHKISAIDVSTNTVTTAWGSVECCSDVAVGEGGVWVSGPNETNIPTVFRLDQETGELVTRIPLPGSAALGIAAGEGSIWVLLDGVDGSIMLVRIDPLTNQVAGTTDLGRASIFWGRSFLEVGEGFVWVVAPADCECEGRVLKINPESGSIMIDTIVGRYPTAVAVGEGFVWVIDSHSFLNTMNPDYLDSADAENYELAVIYRVDPATGELVGGPLIFDQQPSDLTVAHGALWVTHATSHLITRIEVEDLP
jgi:DNA-binding beta-propeller fold protein YncE